MKIGRLIYLTFFLLTIFIFGCAQMPLEIIKYLPQNAGSKLEPSFIQDLNLYNVYEDNNFDVDANVYEYNNIIALLIAVKNKRAEMLSPEDYSIGLADGRDLKPVRMLSRQELLNIKLKYTSNDRGAITDQAIEATMGNVMKIANFPTKEKMAELIDLGANNYFSFRPIYQGEIRQGILCFMPDFKLEYPLTVQVKLPGKVLALKYWPVGKSK